MGIRFIPAKEEVGGVKASFSIDHAGRVVSFALGTSETLDLRVPELLGAIQGAELRGDFVVVMTERGRISYHAETPRRVSNREWRRAHPLAGRIHWHSIRKILRNHCLIIGLAGRVDFQITHFAFESGGRSDVGAAGRVTVDGRVVFQCSAEHGLPWELGAALAEYLFVTPREAVDSDNALVASVALLDRRLSRSELARVDRRRFEHPLWAAFYDLRLEIEAS
jgi:hypothetical protein